MKSAMQEKQIKIKPIEETKTLSGKDTRKFFSYISKNNLDENDKKNILSMAELVLHSNK